MKPINLTIAFSLILTLALNAQDKVLEKIEHKTWFEYDGFAGASIIFYEASNRIKKVIRQINGPGVPVISSGIYDVEIKQDIIFLSNGLNLKKSEKLKDYQYKYGNTAGHIISLRIINEKPILEPLHTGYQHFTFFITIYVHRKHRKLLTKSSCIR
jgi:hypothetical protein